jgi:hypothetical protein
MTVCLAAGADDLGGTLMNESISRAAGAAHGLELSPGFLPVLKGKNFGRYGGAARAGTSAGGNMPRRIRRPRQRKKVLGPDIPVAGGLHNVSAHALNKLDIPINCDVLIAGNHAEAKNDVAQPIKSIGVEVYDAGPIENARCAGAITSI